MHKKILFFIIIGSCLIINGIVFSQKKSKDLKKSNTKIEIKNEEQKKAGPKITFLELGSVSCIPCKQMQPVMKSIEKKYGEQIKVVFHDVWKDEAPAKKYGIKLIPTQVFLDENEKEIFRHQGFYPEKEIDKFLQSKGLKIQQ